MFRMRAAWRGSCPKANERSVLRATVLSIVLTLTTGPNLGVLCKVWCDPAEAATAGCHHEHGNRSASLAGTDDCGHVVFSRAVLVKEDARDGLSSSNTRHAAVVPRYRYPASTSETHLGDEPGCAWPLAKRPPVTALRI
jgi:hypothetical protein